MKKSLQTELWKATHNRMLFVAILIGILLMVNDMFRVSGAMAEFLERVGEDVVPGSPPTPHSADYYSFFVEAGMFNPFSTGAAAFHLVWPILAAMPYADAYAQEHRTGISSQMIARTSTRAYFLSKYVAIFVTGGIAVTVPAVVDLLGCALISPTIKVAANAVEVRNSYFLSRLFFTHPWGYVAAWIPIIFLWGGVTAGLALLVGDRFRNKVFVLLFPFAVYCVLGLVYPLCSPTLQVVPLDMLRMMPDHPTSGVVIFGYAAVLMMTALFFGYRQVKRYEIL